MFIGHYAVALAAKRAAPKASLGTLFLGASFLDLLWPVFLLTGVEHARLTPGITVMNPLDLYDYPLSHSMATSLLYSALAAGCYWLVKRYRAGALTLAVCVFSHWVLDLVSHRPDLPLFPGSSTLVGLSLWNWPVGSIVLEAGMFVAGVWIYARTTSARDRTGRYAFWSLAAILAIIYTADLFSSPPPETDIKVIAWTGLGAILFILWAGWADRHRKSRVLPASGTSGSTAS